jgi:hypothetical protein
MHAFRILQLGAGPRSSSRTEALKQDGAVRKAEQARTERANQKGRKSDIVGRVLHFTQGSLSSGKKLSADRQKMYGAFFEITQKDATCTNRYARNPFQKPQFPYKEACPSYPQIS